MEYNFTYPTTFNIDFFAPYMDDLKSTYGITNVMTKKSKYITVTTEAELTPSQITELNNAINDYSDFNQVVVDTTEVNQSVAWGAKTMRAFELRNIDAQRKGELSPQELMDILGEIHDSFVFLLMLRGSVKLLAGVLFGLPKTTVNGVVWQARAPYQFNSVRQEDLDWLKSELMTYLGTL